MGLRYKNVTALEPLYKENMFSKQEFLILEDLIVLADEKSRFNAQKEGGFMFVLDLFSASKFRIFLGSTICLRTSKKS